MTWHRVIPENQGGGRPRRRRKVEAENMDAYEKYLDQWLPQALQTWQARAWADPATALYLYYRPDGGGLAVVSERPGDTGWELASPRRLSPAWTREQFAQHVRTVCRPLPLLPIGD